MKKLCILFVIVFISCAEKDEKILPQKQHITESVYTSVTIQPDSLYQVYASVAGIIDKIFVEEDDEVKKGTPLIQIINSTPKLNSQNAKLDLELALENYNGNAAILKGIEDEINAAILQFKNDSTTFYRQKNLWDQQIGSKSEFDTKKLKYQLASNNLQLLQSNYTRTKNELKTAVKQAKNRYNSSLINTKDFMIKSTINGKVYALYKNQGELISSVEPLAAIGNSNVFIIEMLVDEVDIVKVGMDQQVVISLDAYTDTVFTGKVSKIFPKKDDRNQTFMVEAIFDAAPDKLYAGLSGEANIIISERDNVLTIPKAYLIDNTSVKTANGIVKVTTGLQNMERIEIISGIDENTFIYRPEE